VLRAILGRPARSMQAYVEELAAARKDGGGLC